MMKRKTGLILIVCLMLAFVAALGCTKTGETGPNEQNAPQSAAPQNPGNEPGEIHEDEVVVPSQGSENGNEQPAPAPEQGTPSVTEAPATEAPATEAPATEAPATDAPATEAPATEAPASAAPEPTDNPLEPYSPEDPTPAPQNTETPDPAQTESPSAAPVPDTTEDPGETPTETPGNGPIELPELP